MSSSVVPASNPLSYVGKEKLRRTFIKKRAPTPQDNKIFEIGDCFIDTAAAAAYMLVSRNDLGGVWALIGTG